MGHPITQAIEKSHRAVLAQHGISADALPLDEMARNAAQAVLSGLECGSIVVEVDLEDVRAAHRDEMLAKGS